jgi:signal transduction histidine kinase
LHRRPGLIYSVALGLAALVIAAKGDTSLSSHLLVAAASGALIGLGSRLWMVTLGVAMLAWLATHLATSGSALWLVAVTLVLGAIPRPRPLPRLPGPVLAAAPVLIALALLLVAQGLAGWPASLLALACVAATLYGAALVAAAIVDRGGPAALPVRSDRVGAIARHFLLGRIAPGLSHDLGQSLNVIIMANSNIAYIVDQLDLSAEERSQLTARIARIGTHSDMAAGILGLLRWFGRDDARDKGAMTVGSALERAIAAVRPQARAARMAIELRGDALDFPAAARQGAIEMIGVAALLDLLATTGEEDGEASRRIVLDASHDGGEVAVRLLSEHMPPEEMRRSPVDQVTLDLASDFAGQCGGEVRQVRRRNDPVQMVIRLKLAAI